MSVHKTHYTTNFLDAELESERCRKRSREGGGSILNLEAEQKASLFLF